MTTNQPIQMDKLSVFVNQSFEPSKFLTQTVTRIIWFPTLLVGCLVFAPLTSRAQNNPVPLAPPSIPPLGDTIIEETIIEESSSPVNSLDYNYENSPIPGSEYYFNNNNAPNIPGSSPVKIYRVEVNGSDPWLLSQVQRIVPGAFVQPGEGVIHVGEFEDLWEAEQRVLDLERQGITAQVVSLDSTTDASLGLGGKWAQSHYLVIVPGSPLRLPKLAARIRRSNISSSYAIRLREAPRGPHIAIGPFTRRENANYWNNYLRSIGMDARVYFGR
ncbi:MAG: hypothetical protein F6K10_08190 [Moorea sp. SIO2B7]|nr:hypothetical protein [Moorena sp. SIO2B7]